MLMNEYVIDHEVCIQFRDKFCVVLLPLKNLSGLLTLTVRARKASWNGFYICILYFVLSLYNLAACVYLSDPLFRLINY